MKSLTSLSISLLISISGLVSSGCIPALVAATAYSSVKTSSEHRKFIRDFHASNALRQETGLPPLDLCTEKYKFDKYWARQDPECKETVKKLDKDEKAYTSREAEQLQGVIENR